MMHPVIVWQTLTAKESAMQKLLLVLTILFLIIVAPSLLIALAAPERLGLILLIWSTVVIITGGVIWVVRRTSHPAIVGKSS
jgi:hypothetical protein